MVKKIKISEIHNRHTTLSLKGIEINEFFLHEYQKCQYRCSKSFNKTRTRVGRFDSKTYSSYSLSLVYEIFKKSLAAASFEIRKKEIISLETYKNIVTEITEKTINANKKIYDKGEKHYSDVRKEVTKRINKNFDIINQYDFINTDSNFASAKFNFSELLKHFEIMLERRKGIYPKLKNDNLPNVKIDIFSTYTNNLNSSYIVTSIIDYINPQLIHRNLYISLVLNYFKYLNDDKYTNLVVYDFLRCTRKIYKFSDIYGKMQLLELMKICSSIQNKGSARTSDGNICDYCENNRGCFQQEYTRISYSNKLRFDAIERPKILI